MAKKKESIIDIELRRALVFAYLMRGDGTAPLHRKAMEYIHEKWMVVKNHPCPEQLLHSCLRSHMFSHLEAWHRFTSDYIKEMHKWGIIQ
jgi:hypothetical protein